MPSPYESSTTETANGCEPGSGSCPPALPRREFLALSGIALASAALDALPALGAMAGPFSASEFERLIPPDKKLRPEWLASLTAKGGRTVYRKDRGELKHIGMPVGGLCCGTLYLGGDGRLWLWDVFNENPLGIRPRSVRWDGFGQERTLNMMEGVNYVQPAAPESPLMQGFALKVDGATRPLDARGWENVEFSGEYPLGIVNYSDPGCPVNVSLTAYSPFIPLHFDDSSLPATVCEFTLTNTGDEIIQAEIGGYLENACSLFSALPGSGRRVNAVRTTGDATLVASRFDPGLTEPPADARPDLTVADFEAETYGDWMTEGTAFGTGPVMRKDVPGYQGDLGGEGERVVNSHASAPGTSVGEKDGRTGTLTSPPFALERKYLAFHIGGGANAEEVGLRLLVDGKPVRRAAGKNDNRMRRAVLDVSEFAGKQGILEIYDRGTGGWGNVGVDGIIQTDHPRAEMPTEKDHDYGTMALALLGDGAGKADVTPDTLFDAPAADGATRPAGEKLLGGVTKSVEIAPGKQQTVSFVVAWHFPNSHLDVPGAETGNHYAKRFSDAAAVAEYVAKEHMRLSRDTKLWHATWYDSTLPHWFLDRTFVNTSILATSTCHRFASGRFWGWEGIGCCPGTCTHVWHYAQAVGRVFPEVERHLREHVDFGVGFDEKTGKIGHRGEDTAPAVDGQCGRILGAYREHQMSADDAFLRRVWPRVKAAVEFLIHHDGDGDGLIDGAQENTLDAAWFGKIAWISSLYAAALRAGEEMAKERGDDAFAKRCRERFEGTKRAIEAELYNGEYFVQKPEPGREKALGTYETCHIDQVHGQSWAWQVDLGRVLDREKTVSALKALYKYNFALDVGPFRRKNKPGRAYALAGDAGLLMATNPKGLPHPFGNDSDWQYGYFNECMSGFEHQAASHMIAEGLVTEGLAVTRAVHDRYHAALRNPYNEIECSDHYSRAMASYGSFLTLCGFTYHGPEGRMGFAPRLRPDDFRTAFTAAEGWGTFSQKKDGKALSAEVQMRHGRLKLNALELVGEYAKVAAKVYGAAVPATVEAADGRTTVTFAPGLMLTAGHGLRVTLS